MLLTAVAAALLLLMAPSPAAAQPTPRPTQFPTLASSSQTPMQPLYLDEWQRIHNALRGTDWLYCGGEESFFHPCSFIALNCRPPTRLVCDQRNQLIEIVLPRNLLQGILPERSLQVLGRTVQLLDLSGNAGLSMPHGRTCLQLDFCFSAGVKCILDFPLCQRAGTLAPSSSPPPMNPADAYLYGVMYDTLGLKKLQPVMALCPNSPFMTCVLSAGELFISELHLGGLQLAGFFPYSESTLTFFTKLVRLDLSNNAMDPDYYDDDCFRFDACWRDGGVECNFAQSGLELCAPPLLPSIYSQLPGLMLSNELLAYWQWFYYELHMDVGSGGAVLSSQCVNSDRLLTDPCAACPSRIVCVPGQGSGLIVFQSISLAGAGLTGTLSAATVLRFFSLGGLERLDLGGVNTITNTNATAPCMSLPPCLAAGAAGTCNLGPGISLCGTLPPSPGHTLKPTMQPTKQPTLSSNNSGGNPSPCGTTTGGFVAEGTACAVPFTYASMQFRQCLRMSDFMPLRNDTRPIPSPRVPTDLWCPTVGVYNQATANDWGYCDCFRNELVTTAPTSVAPTRQFSSAPTLEPTLRPTTLQPTTPTTTTTTARPTTTTSASQRLPAAQLAAWTSMYDSLNGAHWTACSDARLDPCACESSSSSSRVRVVCSETQSTTRRRRLDEETGITHILLPGNNCSGGLRSADVLALASTTLQQLDLDNNQGVTLVPAATKCRDVCLPTLTVCRIGAVCNGPGGDGDSSSSGGVDLVPIVVGVVCGVVLLCCLLVFCFKCRDRRPSTGKKTATALAATAGGDTTTKATTTTTYASAKTSTAVAAPMNPAFAVMVGKAETSGSAGGGGGGGFSALDNDDDLEAAASNSATLEDAKLAALKLDDTARRDVPDVDAFLSNLDLLHHLPALRARSPAGGGKLDIITLYKFSDATLRDAGLTVGDRVRLKRALDIRKGLGGTDPVFG